MVPGLDESGNHPEVRERAGLIGSDLLAARSLSQPFRVANYRLKVVGSKILVTHDDPITTAMPTAGPVEVGMSTSKEVEARMTSLGKQRHPTWLGEGGAHQLGCGRLFGMKTGWEEGGGRKTETLVYRSRASGKGRETTLLRNDRSQAGKGRQRIRIRRFQRTRS